MDIRGVLRGNRQCYRDIFSRVTRSSTATVNQSHRDMGTNRLPSILPGCISIFLLLVTSSATEVYDEAPADLIDAALAEQDDNSIETGASRDQFAAELTAKELLIYKLIMSLRNLQTEHRQEYNERSRYHHIPPLEEQRDRLPTTFAYETEKEKRLSDLLKGSSSTRHLAQQKWKTKKGKVIGSQMVCYFKLCAFRSPS